MNRTSLPIGVVVALLLSVVWIEAAGTNIAPDAITRATLGYNRYEGELSSLTDGLTPDNSDQADLFVWPSKGNLVFEFAAPRAVAGVRLCIGKDAGSYAALAYLGATYGASGQTETTAETLFADVYDAEFLTDGWVELAFPPGTVTDYIELITQSGAEFYEIEILATVPATQVMSISWGQVKHRIQ